MISDAKTILAYLIASLSIVGVSVAVAMVWVRNSQTRQFREGPVVHKLWGSHGIHSLDLVVVAIEVILFALLIAVLWRGFTHDSGTNR